MMFVVGAKEAKAGSSAIRLYGGKDLGSTSADEVSITNDSRPAEVGQPDQTLNVLNGYWRCDFNFHVRLCWRLRGVLQGHKLYGMVWYGMVWYYHYRVVGTTLSSRRPLGIAW